MTLAQTAKFKELLQYLKLASEIAQELHESGFESVEMILETNAGSYRVILDCDGLDVTPE